MKSITFFGKYYAFAEMGLHVDNGASLHHSHCHGTSPLPPFQSLASTCVLFYPMGDTIIYYRGRSGWSNPDHITWPRGLSHI